MSKGETWDSKYFTDLQNDYKKLVQFYRKAGEFVSLFLSPYPYFVQ